MKLARLISAAPQSAFTMVEIAISLAVIGFALVAIIGVLPYGLQVQKENNQETIINQDATVFLEAIRTGARGLDDLTNYVFAITNYWTKFAIVTNGNSINTNFVASDFDGYTHSGSRVTSVVMPPDIFPINGSNIVGLLTKPKYLPPPGSANFFYSNYIIACVQALSGSVVEKFPQNNSTVLEGAFSYHLAVEIEPTITWDTLPVSQSLQNNLYELRLRFRWPLYPNGGTGYGRQTFGTLVSGILTNDPPNSPAYFFVQPQTFAHAP